jgi:hypothetical protein
MHQVTRYSAPGGYLFQVIAGRDMTVGLTEMRAGRLCEQLGQKYLTAFNVARDAADAPRVTVPA